MFINNATIGSATGAKGTFTLYNVKPGKYYVIVTVIGFETYSQEVTIADHNIIMPDIALSPKITALKEVVIRVNHNREKYFNLYYQLFKDEFLGTSDVARDCNILNPEQLDFDFDNETNILTVSTDDFLQIDNPDLGYKIKYLLKSFTLNVMTREVHYEGPVLFTEMKGSPGKERDWQQNRKKAYEGSNMHFLRSLLNDKLEEDGFRIYQLMPRYPNFNRAPDSVIKKMIKEYSIPLNNQRYPDSLPYWKKMLKEPKILQTLFPNPLNKEDLVRPADQPGRFNLGCDSALLVLDYVKNHHYTEIKQLQDLSNLKFIINKENNKELTLIELGTLFFSFDSNGSIADPDDIRLSGVWARNRVGNLLPVNYETGQGTTLSADSTITGIKNKISDFTTAHATEKVHLQLDRAWYAIGDTIWFKAYTVAGPDHRLSQLSGALHTELINDKDSVVKRLTLRLDQGVCSGDMILPQSYRSGIYRIRAYTNWMLNDSAYFYDQKVVIGGLPQPTAANSTAATIPANGPAQKTPANIDFQFFPEGGELVTGLRSKVAFKAIGPNGLSQDVSGVITDQDGTEITSFSSQHLGMGEFPLTPLPGKIYQAKVSTANGAVFTIALPQAKPFGFTLTINNAGDSIYVKVAASDTYYNNNRNSPFYLIAQSGGKSYYLASSTLTGLAFTTQIEKTRFPSGIVQFTLFSKTGEPLNQRIIYVENNDQLKLGISAQKNTYSPHDAVKLDIEAKDKNDNNVAGNFSIAVTDETQFPVDEQAEPTIQTDLLLTSDLKGYVENPNYYFLNEDEKTRSDLDLLMLTQGYRTFNWKQIFAGKAPKITYEPQSTISLSGTIKTAKGRPIANRKVRLTSIKDHLLIDTLSDTNGHFTFTGLDLSDTTKVILSLVKLKGVSDDDVKFYLNEPPYPNVDKISSAPGYADTAFSPAVKKAMELVYHDGRLGNGIQLKEVAIKARRRNPVFEPIYSDNMKFSANMNGPGNANQVFLGSNLVGCIKLSDCLQGRLFGVQFSATGIPQSTRASTRYLTGGAPPMAVFIEGLQHNPADLDNINPEDVYSIEVLTSISYLTIYGSNAPNGALIITLKRGSDYNPAAIPVNGLVTYKVNGFYKSREFYSPKYNPAIPQKTPDNRKTIYWNPNITTGPDGKTSVDYFNAGSKGTYRVVIEGIDANGNLGRQVFRYKVE